tara:strand:+ start:105 stop:641 length:537 start_codon:yes stop_codon:yes gene_type:complete
MADIQIIIGDQEEPDEYVFSLNARKTLSGDIVVRDHPDIDIVLMVEKKKILAFPKEDLTNEVYQTQDKLFNFLIKKGIVSHESVQGGNLHGSMEAQILESDKLNVIKFSLMSVAKFIEQEKPYFEYLEEFEKLQNARLVEPSESESTDYDSSRHSDVKGAMQSIYIRNPYGMSFTYRE